MGYSEGTVGVQWGYSEGTVGVQWGYSGDTMYPNLRSPKEEGIYLDRRRLQEFHAATTRYTISNIHIVC